MSVSSINFREEESRIREVYSQRHPGSVYSRFDPAHLFEMQERERYFLRLLAKSGCRALHKHKILEVGCGNGELLRDLIKWGARPENTFGIDLIPERILEARTLCPQGISIEAGNAAEINFPDKTFDLVFQSTVFTSVLDYQIKASIALEMLRVAKPDGIIFWYDFSVNNPLNKNVKGVRLREMRRLFQDCDIVLKRITLAPPIARLLAPYSWILCYFLSKVPLLCTHYLAAIRKRISN